MAGAHNGSQQRIALAAGSQGNMEVVVHIDGKEEASYSPKNTALVGTSSFNRRRHKQSLPKKQISLGTNQGKNNNFGVSSFIDTNGKNQETEEAPLPKETIALAGIQLQGDVVIELSGAVVDVPEEPIAGSKQSDNQEEASPTPGEEEFEADDDDGAEATGLPEQALMTIIGNYIERVGQIIALIGLASITSTIGGLFTRGTPVLFVYFLISQVINIMDSLYSPFPNYKTSFLIFIYPYN